MDSTDDSQFGIYLRIYSDVAGSPGSPMGGKFLTTNPYFTNSIQTYTDESLGSTHLLANTDYWVVLAVQPLSAANPRFKLTTFSPGDGPGSIALGMKFSTNYGGSWAVAPAAGATSDLRMEINGVQITVPEPSTAVLAGIGLIGLAAYGSRRQRMA